MSLLGADDSHIGRGLGQARKSVAHPLDSVRAGKDGLHGLADHLRADVAGSRSALFIVNENHIRVRVLILELGLLELFLHESLDLTGVR